MSHLISLLLKPWADLISKDEPTTLWHLITGLDKTITGLVVALALYALALQWLNIGQFLDRITAGQNIPKLTDQSDLLIALSVPWSLNLSKGKRL